jgi:diguanylate cyclase (GGDEF)-like protein
MQTEPPASAAEDFADVLIVDDTPANISILTEALEDHDCRCRVATSGKRALAAVAAKVPDVILLDIMMPEMDGFEVCRRLKAHHETAEVPVLFISALGEPFDKVRAFACGAADYVTKPFHIGEVRARVRVQIRLRRLQRALEALSTTDALTGLANRRRFEEVLDGEWARAERHGDALSLLMIDVDFFKLYNDLHGHLAGDDCLRRVAGALAGAVTRAADLVARYGGEEFVAVLPGTDVSGCRAQAERLRRAVHQLSIPHGDTRAAANVTISVGGATLTPNAHASPTSLVEAADNALYRAKETGRDRAVVGSD